MSTDRKEILKALLLSEDDNNERFAELIKKSASLFKINSKSGNIVFEIMDFSNAEKISLYLIGQYFAHELSLNNGFKKNSSDISKELMIKATTLSAPLGQLTSANYVTIERAHYFINHYKINTILESLINKYADHQKQVKAGVSLKVSADKKKKPSSNSEKNKLKSDSSNGSDKHEIIDIKYNSNPSGIKDLAKDLETTEEQ